MAGLLWQTRCKWSFQSVGSKWTTIHQTMQRPCRKLSLQEPSAREVRTCVIRFVSAQFGRLLGNISDFRRNIAFWSKSLSDYVRTTCWSSVNNDENQWRAMNYSFLHTQVLLEAFQKRVKELVWLNKPAVFNVIICKMWKNVQVVKIDTERWSSWTNDTNESSCILRIQYWVFAIMTHLRMTVQTLTSLERVSWRIFYFTDQKDQLTWHGLPEASAIHPKREEDRFFKRVELESFVDTPMFMSMFNDIGYRRKEYNEDPIVSFWRSNSSCMRVLVCSS